MDDNAATTAVIDSGGCGNKGTSVRNTSFMTTTGKIDTALRSHEHTGRPFGSDNFVMKLEGLLSRMLKPKKAGRPKKKMPK